MTPALECRRLALHYGAGVTVGPLTLQVPAGTCAALVGPNGAGKSSLIHMLLGLRPPTAGTAVLHGVAASDPRARARTGYVPENVDFPPSATAGRLLALHASLAGPRAGRKAADAAAYLKEFGLEWTGKRVGAYSKGMRQRLALALAFLDCDRLLVLDEPNNGLDPAGIALLRRKLLDLKSQGVTILLSTHRLAEIPSLADLVLVLHKGRLAGSSSMQAFAGLEALEDYFLGLTGTGEASA